jgi:hypothetical protein
MNTYTGAKSGTKTNETTTECYSMCKDGMQGSEYHRTETGVDDLAYARDARKKRDEENMYQGLRDFNGRQRGWNGERESDRQRTIQKHHEIERKKSQIQAEKERAAFGTFHSPLRTKRVNSEELMEVIEEVKSQREIEVMVLEDAGNRLMEQAHAMMMSRSVDMDAIIAEAHGRSRKYSGAAPMTLESPSPSPAQERNELRGRIGTLGGSPPRGVQLGLESPSPEVSPNHQLHGRRQSSNAEEASKENDPDSAVDLPTDEQRPNKRLRPFGTDITEKVLAKEKKARDHLRNTRT